MHNCCGDGCPTCEHLTAEIEFDREFGRDDDEVI